jgi:hypothetical protein
MHTIDNVEFSDETIKSALIKAGHRLEKPKLKFEPIKIHFGCFVVGIDRQSVLIKTGGGYNGATGCLQDPHGVEKFIQALQEAKAFVEANKIYASRSKSYT